MPRNSSDTPEQNTAHDLLLLLTHLSSLDNTEQMARLFVEGINGMGLGITLKPLSAVGPFSDECVEVRTAHTRYSQFAVIEGDLDALPRELHAALNNGMQLLALLMEGVANRNRLEMKSAMQLAASEQRYRELFDNMSDGVIVYSVVGDADDFIITDLNRVAIQMGITTRDAAIGHSILSVFPGVVSMGFFAVLQRVSRTGEPEHLPQNHYQDDKLDLWVECYVYRLPTGEVIAVFGDVTKRILAEAALQESRTQLRSVIDAAPMWIAACDKEYRYLVANKYFEETFDKPIDEIEGQPFLDILPAEIVDRHAQLVDQVFQGEAVSFDETLALGGDIPERHVSGNYAPLRDAKGTITGVVAAVMDITERVLMQKELDLAHSELKQQLKKLKLAGTVFDSTAEGVLIADASAQIIDVNRAFSDILGYTREEVLGKTPSLWKSGRHDRAFYQAMWSSLVQADMWCGEIWNRRKDGTIFPEWLTINAVKNKAGELVNYVAVFADITHIKQSEKQLDFLAHHDPLTELPNRLLFNARLQHAINHAARNNEELALLFIDLDRFKNINDSHGHSVGDILLKAVGERLLRSVRADDTVARIGGDEFTVLVEGIESTHDVVGIAEKILRSFKEEFEFDGHQLFITPSIGISIYSQDGQNAEELMRNADAAMYSAKDAGRCGYAFYREELTSVAFERVLLESSMRHGLDRQEFVLNYQPQIDMRTGKFHGAEVLVRWQHPDMGLLGPMKFIPAAEELGLIIPLGEWILRTALSRAKSWCERGSVCGVLSINASAVELQQRDYADKVIALVRETGFDPSRLELEVTEGLFLGEFEVAAQSLHRLRDFGISIAIDDFGTGYSSLSYLKRLPIDRLKIDRSFVQDIPGDENDVAITRAVISLAKSLQLEVTAEGVETEIQRDFLLSEGCHIAQGYLFARPMPEQEFLYWLENLALVNLDS